MPSCVHTQEYLPAVHAAIAVMIPKHSALGLQPPMLLLVGVPFDVSLTLIDEHSLPYS